jgi:hypothetical protein
MKSAKLAIDGLQHNPLVPSSQIAEALGSQYLKKHSTHLDYLK